MATLTSGNTLSLNNLASATGQTTKSFSAAKGDTTGPIAMSSFAIDSADSITGYTYAVEGTSEVYTLGFSGAGANFSRISGRAANFTWSVPVGSYISLTTNSGASATFTVGTMNPQSPSAQEFKLILYVQYLMMVLMTMQRDIIQIKIRQYIR